jgi:hypothetical protein
MAEGYVKVRKTSLLPLSSSKHSVLRTSRGSEKSKYSPYFIISTDLFSVYNACLSGIDDMKEQVAVQDCGIPLHGSSGSKTLSSR